MSSSRTDPAVAQIRSAVRRALAALPEPARVAPPVVACSGGADSLALATAVADLDIDARAAVVDHGLQPGSDAVAAVTAERLTALGLPASILRVTVGTAGGPEGAARRARYAALAAARPHPDSPILLGHTLDDQAETVLLGLGRGSGPRSLAGMREWDAPWCRPLLGVRRDTTRAACAARGLDPWEDPHNADPRFVRVRLRREVLPLLEEVLAGGVAEALARTATQLREDAGALDSLVGPLLAEARDATALDPAPLAAVSGALRRRVLRAWLQGAGVAGLTDRHLRAADRVLVASGGVASVALPGGLELVRARDRLWLRPVAWPR